MLVTIIIVIAGAMLYSYAKDLNNIKNGGTASYEVNGKPATHTFQGSGYCDTHYKDAITWSLEHSK